MSNAEEKIKERFVRDIRNHKMEVLLDNGLYRHLKFSDGTFNMAFNIITVPGRLWYCGDAGSFTFCRLVDMFELFRSSKPGGPHINPSYLAQKVESIDRDGLRQYSPDETRNSVIQHCRGCEWPEAAIQKLDDSIDFSSHDTSEVIEQLNDFSFTDLETGEEYGLGDDDHDFISYEFTLRFLWCCCALVWGIDQYDKHKAQEVVR